ncbi:hypothetical protein D3C86_1823680 [compost metagenome]
MDQQLLAHQARAHGGSRDHEGHGTLAPLVIGHTDHRRFLHARNLGDQPFDFNRRDPFAAGLDHVLEAVDDLHHAVGVHHGQILGVQVAAAPQLFGSLRLFGVQRRQRR